MLADKKTLKSVLAEIAELKMQVPEPVVRKVLESEVLPPHPLTRYPLGQQTPTEVYRLLLMLESSIHSLMELTKNNTKLGKAVLLRRQAENDIALCRHCQAARYHEQGQACGEHRDVYEAAEDAEEDAIELIFKVGVV